MAYDSFYASLSTRASVNEILNQALAAKEEITALSSSTVGALDDAIDVANAVTLTNQQIQSQVNQTASTAGLAAGRAELSAVEANTYAGLSLTNATNSEASLVACQAIQADIGDVDARFDAVDDKFDYYDQRIQPIQQTDVSAMDESIACVGGGVQAEFKEKIVQPPVGIVTAYSSRVVVRPAVPWNNGWTSGFANGIIAEDGGKRINKMVVSYTQTDALNEGSSAILGYEHSLGAIGPNSNHDALSDFFSPNLEFVPNKHRVQKMAAFTNQDKGKVVQSFGPIIDSTFREHAPADHPGYVAGRFYTNPFWWVEPRDVPANTALLMPIHIKARVHIDSFRMFTGGGAGGQYRVGIYSAVQGTVAERVLLSAKVNSPGPNMQLDIPLDKQLDPGMYWFGVACSVTGQTMLVHKVYDKGYKSIAINGHENPTAATKEGLVEQLAVIALPSLDAMDTDPKIPPQLVNVGGSPEPHLFFKVKAIPLPSYPGNGRPTNN